MKLKFIKEETTDIWLIYEDGKDTNKRKYEHLGLIFKDELGVHWNIAEDYTGIIELEELNQITFFMQQIKDDVLEVDNE